MTASNLLGEYLRACRARLSPAEVGLESLGIRRVAGLRREEVALLAGISANYYLRLEQGRDRNPSEQVLTSLARALRLDSAAAAHLRALGHPPVAESADTTELAVPRSITQLLGTLPLPAWAQDSHFDVVASNATARALSPRLRPGQNRLLSLFLDAAERAMFLDIGEVLSSAVASFRASVAAYADDSRTIYLIERLSAEDPVFHRLWTSHRVVDVVDRPPVRLAHQVFGTVTVTRDNLAIDSLRPLRLLIYHAAAGTPDAATLARINAAAEAHPLHPTAAGRPLSGRGTAQPAR